MRFEHGGGDRGNGMAQPPGERSAGVVACEGLVPDRAGWARSRVEVLTPVVPMRPAEGTAKIAA